MKWLCDPVFMALLVIAFVCVASGTAHASPDLIVTSLTVDDDVLVKPLDSTTIRWTIKNQGSSDATPVNYWFRVMLSTDTTYDDPGDTYVAGRQITVNLGPQETYSSTFNLNSGSYPTGEFYLVAMVDAYNIVAESDNNNNTRSSSMITIEPAPETISKPGTPSGETSPPLNTSYTYTTSGATSSLGHPVEYQFDWGDGTSPSTWSLSTSAGHEWETAGDWTVTVTARCQIHIDKTNTSSGLVVAAGETISTPGTPSGQQSPEVGTSYTYSTTGATSNLGHTVEYQFDWDDGSTSSWSTSTSANHTWNSEGVYNVTVTARCQTHTNKTNTSNGLTVDPVPVDETITKPATPTGETDPDVGTTHTYSTTGASSSEGHTVEYQFNWGDGTASSPWSTSLSANHTWNSEGVYNVTVTARCQTHTNINNISNPLQVTVDVETITKPATPSGNTSPELGPSYTYSTTGASSSEGHTVEYQFDWDASGGHDYSTWSTSTSANHTWTSAGTYTVKVTARCQTHTDKTNISDGLPVNPTTGETISTPGTPSGQQSPEVGTSYTYSTSGATSSLGHTVEYQFDWDASGGHDYSTWSTSPNANHTWTSEGIYNVTVTARCQTHTNITNISDPLQVTVVAPLPELELIGLEVIQTIQDWNNSVPLIANKKTWVRAHVKTKGLPYVRIPKAFLHAYREDGSELEYHIIVNKNPDFLALPTTERGNWTRSLNFELPPDWDDAGVLNLQLSLFNCALDCQNAAATDNNCNLTVEFLQTAKPRIKLFAVKWYDSQGKAHKADYGDLTILANSLTSIYPVSELNWIPGQTQQPGNTDGLINWWGINMQLSTMWHLNSEKDFFYFGVVKGSPTHRIPLGHAGSSNLYWPPVGSGLMEQRVIAHEVGHLLLGPGHIPCTLLPNDPYDQDSLIWGLDVTYIKSDIPYYALKSPLPTTLPYYQYFALMNGWPYDCSPQYRWISYDTYTAIRDEIENRFGGAAAAMAMAESSSLSDYLIVRGTIDFDGNSVQFLPFTYLYNTISSPSNPEPGDYTLETFDGNGVSISSVSFQPSEFADIPEGYPRTGSFIISIEADPNIVQVAVIHDANTIGLISASDNSPVVQVLIPNGGEIFDSNQVSMEWVASDSDSNDLTYVLQYSQDAGGTWETLAVDWPDPNYQVERKYLTASENGLVRVIVSDGFNTAMDDSDGVFTVQNNAPYVIISAPQENAFHVGEQHIFFEATTYDREDGQLSGDSLEWSSDIDGFLGTGTILIRDANSLSQGRHLITVTATDSNGLSDTASINIRIFRTLGDFTLDGHVDVEDLAVLAGEWVESNGSLFTDIAPYSLDGIVNLRDFSAFAQNWLKHDSYSYTVTDLTQLTSGSLQETEGIFNAGGTKIAYRNLHEPYSWDNCDIWVMDSDGSNKTQITTDSRGEFAPSFVPDGRITYTKEFGSNDYDIWMVEGNGNNPQSFIGGAYRQSNPKWNSSGTKVVYVDEYQYQGPGEIWLANADGTGKIKLTDHTVDGYGQLFPVFSRAGNKIAYGNMATSSSPPNIWVMNADGSEKQQITNNVAAQYSMFWWSDDSRIGYVENGKIWLHDLSTTSEEILLEVPDGSVGIWCDLSLDGSKLVFDRSDGSGTHIWIGDVILQSD